MKILGISAFYHDSAAAIIKDGKIIAAAQEERFTRIKQDASFPRQACTYCLKEANLSINDLDAVVFYDKPFLKFERLLETYYQFAPRGFQSFINAMPVWLQEKIFLKRIIRKELSLIHAYDKRKLKLLFTEHHLAHAASAFFASSFQKAAILTLDGVGEWATASISYGVDNKITSIKELHFPHSPGLLYSAFTYFLGFKVNGGEYKLMGLAPYGNPNDQQVHEFKNIILSQLIDLKDDGSLWLNQSYFTFATRLKMVDDKKWVKLFSVKKRNAEDPIEQVHCNLAYAIQAVIEMIVIKMATEAQKATGAKQLCLAGGVALNCVANGKLLEAGIFDQIYIQPAAGDAGGALGAALATHFIYYNQKRQINKHEDFMRGAQLGPQFSRSEIQSFIEKKSIPHAYYENFERLCEEVSDYLATGKVVGWFQGRMEYGPRALGNRSILGDPRNDKMQQTLNLKIKNRESFRPFAPAILEEDLSTYFALNISSPYMLLVKKINPNLRKKRSNYFEDLSLKEKCASPLSILPAITHVDYSSRIQTVNKSSNPKFYELLTTFKKKSKHGVLINTSFNIKDEPIVCMPSDAYNCFIKTDMDFLVMDNFLLSKKTT